MEKIISIMLAFLLTATGFTSIGESTINNGGKPETKIFTNSSTKKESKKQDTKTMKVSSKVKEDAKSETKKYSEGATITGSGKEETKIFELSDFKEIYVTHVFQVTIEKSDNFYVEMTYDDNLAEYIKVKVEGDTLKLSMDNKYNYNKVNTKVTIKMPDINCIKGSGVTSFKFKEGFEFDHDFYAYLSGVSSLSGNIKTGDIEINISGSSKVSLDGYGKDLTCKMSGVVGADLVDFLVQNADVKISGSSNATINTNGKIKVQASGVSTLEYKGNPTIESIQESGTAKVKKIK